MERAKRPYSIQKRPSSKKNRSVYYVQFRNPETTKYMTAVSSGQSSKSNAQNWADEQIKSGKVIVSDKKNIFFESFAKEFWDWDTSPYVKGKLARGMQIGRSHVATCAGYIERHVLPPFKGRTLASITTADVEAWLLMMKEKGGLKAKSINLIYMSFRTILKEAFRLGFISADPTIRVQGLAEEKPRRGILSIAELKKLFAGDALATRWKGNLKLYVANILAASTGMREGEIRGLLIKDVHDDYIDVQHSWEQGYGLKGAKWGSERRVTVPKSVTTLLAKLIEQSPYKNEDDLVFYGESRTTPLHTKAFINALYDALATIGINEEERKARAITFHSWRHFLNSVSRGRVPDEKLRLMTGHRTEEMTEHYTHLLEEDYTEIRKVQEDIFGDSKRVS
jgi:integrase